MTDSKTIISGAEEKSKPSGAAVKMLILAVTVLIGACMVIEYV